MNKATHLLLASLLALAGAASAQTRGTTPEGIGFVTGGISIEELREMEREKARHSFWLTTAAKGSGAHLSDAEVRIKDAKDKVVFFGLMTGPWLMVDLPPGRYVVEVVFRGQHQKRNLGVQKGGRQQMVLYFDSDAEVSPDWQSPFKDNPYK